MAFILGFGWVPASVEKTKIKITKKDCRRLVRHQARSDVVYKPGVDVRGKKVVPTDIRGPSPIKLQNVFEFDVNIEIRKYLDGPEADAAAAVSSDSNTALIAVHRKAQKYGSLNMSAGKVRFNIKTGALAEACKDILKRERWISSPFPRPPPATKITAGVDKAPGFP